MYVSALCHDPCTHSGYLFNSVHLYIDLPCLNRKKRCIDIQPLQHPLLLLKKLQRCKIVSSALAITVEGAHRGQALYRGCFDTSQTTSTIR